MKNAEKGTLVLGIGNDILTDDGIGPKLVANENIL
jgi:Ni,Fe-hydrogenase maturation factor